MKLLSTLAAAAALATTATAAEAVVFNFTITGDYEASFSLDTDDAPDDFSEGVGFVRWDVEGFDDAIFGVADVYFYNASLGGGIGIEDFYLDETLYLADGDQLYTGSEESPFFVTGTFALDGTPYGFGEATITITSAEAVVPEPAAWAMMLTGFGLVGGAMRRRAAAPRQALA